MILMANAVPAMDVLTDDAPNTLLLRREANARMLAGLNETIPEVIELTSRLRTKPMRSRVLSEIANCNWLIHLIEENLNHVAESSDDAFLRDLSCIEDVAYELHGRMHYVEGSTVRDLAKAELHRRELRRTSSQA